MPYKAKLKSGMVISAIILSAAQGGYADDENEIEISIYAGAEYNDNIAVSDIDLGSGQGDFAGLLEVSLGYENKISENLSFSAGYDFSYTRFVDETAFNFQSHGLSAGLSGQMAGLDLGLDYSFFHNRLGGESFLDMQLFSPSIAKMFPGNIYVRAAYTYMDKDFETALTRSGNNQKYGVDSYFFFDGGGFFRVGAAWQEEDAAAAIFDYDGLVLNAQVKVPVGEGDFYVKGNYKKRTYDSGLREDKRTSLRAGLELPFMDNLIIKPEYRFLDSSSNLASADYSEHVFSLMFGIEF